MPTYDQEGLFASDYKRLSADQQARFLAAVRQMVADLHSRRPSHPRLRTKSVQGHPGIFEMTWEMPNGRATFRFGPERVPGEAHVIWRRVGGHEILKQP